MQLGGHLHVLAAAVLWSFGGMFIKVLTGPYGVDPRAVACLRCAVAGLVLSWALPRIGPVPRGRVALTGVVFTLVVGTFVLATAGTSAANAILLQYAAPLFVAVGAVWWFHERLRARTVAALALGLGGVAIILGFSWGTPGRTGVLYGLASAVVFALLMLLQRSIRTGDPVALSSVYNLMGAALLFPFAWGVLAVSGQALLVVTVMGIVQLGVPYVFFIRGLRQVTATDAALITLIEPVLNPIWVWLVVREEPHWSTFLGGALILLALGVRFAGACQAAAVPVPDQELA
jgi:drug/metabolite transporter (DMT)-like permease